MYRYLPLTILHPCMKYKSCTLKTKVLTKFSCGLDLWPFDFKMYRYMVSFSHHPASMYKIWKLNIYIGLSYNVRTKVLTDRQRDRWTHLIPIGHPPKWWGLNNKPDLSLAPWVWCTAIHWWPAALGTPSGCRRTSRWAWWRSSVPGSPSGPCRTPWTGSRPPPGSGIPGIYRGRYSTETSSWQNIGQV